MRMVNKRIVCADPTQEAYTLADRPLNVLHAGNFLSLVREGPWEFVTRRGKAQGVVGVIAVTHDNHLLLVEQFRPPVGCRVIEPPAGLAGDGAPEALSAAAARELLEETGHVPGGPLTLLMMTPSSPGLSDEVIVMYLARGCRRVSSRIGEGDEQITLHAVPLGPVAAFLMDRQREGVMVDFKIAAGLWAMSVPGSTLCP
jgi:ADP-ribose pyrophosphatase